MSDSYPNLLAHETAPLSFDDLEWIIAGLMGPQATQAEALIVSEWCWGDNVRTGADLAARWPTEPCFFSECHSAYELAVDLEWRNA